MSESGSAEHLRVMLEESRREVARLRGEVTEANEKLKQEWLLRSRFQHRVDALEQALVWAAQRDKEMQEEILKVTRYSGATESIALAV